MFLSRDKSVIGVDIGSSSVKLVGLKRSKGLYSLEYFQIAPLEPETIVDGTIVSKDNIIDKIREMMVHNSIKAKNVSTSVSGHSVIMKKFSYPYMTQDELEENIQWEIEQYIPFDRDDVYYDVQIIDGNDMVNEAGKMEVILVAAKKEVVNEYTDIFVEAGLKPMIMDVDAFAIENMFQLNYPGYDNDVVALVNIGATITNVNILESSASAFTRDINIGGNLYTSEIQKQMNVSMEQAESLKLGGDFGAPMETTEAVIPQEVGGIIRSVSESITGEIQRSLDFYAASSAKGRVSRIFLMGGSSKIPSLSNVIETKLELPVEIVNPFKEIEVNQEKFNFEQIQEVSASAAVAVGLAMRELGD
ncbi:MAG: type IV pilus assembly protein PilM [Deltaproteobacteria bacterium]|nr:type IV pilus assembly protein PilM [Deltaproteobacteria bacterium]